MFYKPLVILIADIYTLLALKLAILRQTAKQLNIQHFTLQKRPNSLSCKELA